MSPFAGLIAGPMEKCAGDERANAQLVELRKAEKWNGSLPATMLSNVAPFMGVDQTGIKK